MKGTELVSHDTFDRGAPELLGQRLPGGLLYRSKHVAASVCATHVEGLGRHAAADAQWGQASATEPAEVGYRDGDGRGPQLAVSLTCESAEEATGVAVIRG